jgi:hypothetical protein
LAGPWSGQASWTELSIIDTGCRHCDGKGFAKFGTTGSNVIPKFGTTGSNVHNRQLMYVCMYECRYSIWHLVL